MEDYNSTYGIAKSDTESSIFSDITGVAVASVVDFGATTWNSLPFTEDVDTRDLLSGISDNAMEMYDMHPDMVHTISFIGGLAVSGGLALKGISMMKAGASAGWFGSLLAEKKIADLGLLIEGGSQASLQYKAAKSAILLNGIKAGIGEAAAAEVTMLAMQNEHPYLQDYWDNPVSNLTTSLAFGGIIGGAGKLIRANYLTNKVAGETLAGTINKVEDAVDNTVERTASLDKLVVEQQNTRMMQGLIDEIDSTPLQKEVAASYLADIHLNEVNLLDNLLPVELKTAKVEVKRDMVKFLTDNPLRFAGVDEVKVFTPSATLLKAESALANTEKGQLYGAAAKLIEDIAEDETKVSIPKVVYLPRFNAVVSDKDAMSFVGAADMGMTLEALDTLSISKIAKQVAIGKPLNELASHELDTRYMAGVMAIDNTSAKDIAKTIFNHNDTPNLQALIHSATTNTADFGTIKIRTYTAEGEPIINALPLAEVKNLVAGNKAAEIDVALKLGMPMQEIAVKTNLPAEIVANYITTPKSLAVLDSLVDNAVYKGRIDVEEAFKIENKAKELIVAKNYPSSRAAEIISKVNIDAAFYNQIGDEFVADTLLMGGTTSTAVSSFLKSSKIKEVAGYIEDSVGELNSHLVDGGGINSADFTLRNTSIGKIITTTGTAISRARIINADSIVTPIADSVARAIRNPVALAEINLGRDILRGLSGKRIVDSEAGMIYTVSKTGDTISTVPVTYNGVPYKFVTEEAKDFWREMQIMGDNNLKDLNTKRKILGQEPIKSIGTWDIPLNPKDKHISYAYNKVSQEVKLIYGNTGDGLLAKEGIFKQHLAGLPDAADWEIVPKSRQELWSRLNGRNDGHSMGMADSTMVKRGQTSAGLVTSGVDELIELIDGITYYSNKHFDDLIELNLSDTLHAMNRIDSFSSRAIEGQPINNKFAITKGNSTAKQAINTLLGKSNQDNYSAWNSVNGGVKAALDYALTGFTSAFTKFSKSAKTELDYEELTAASKEVGAVNYFEQFGDKANAAYAAASPIYKSEAADNLVRLSGHLASTVALRAGDMSAVLVNIVSTPIMTHLAASADNPVIFMGAEKAVGIEGSKSIQEILYNGARRSNHPVESKRLDELWEGLGLYESYISEASHLTREASSIASKGVGITDKVLESNILKWLGTPANKADSFLRRQAMYTGYDLGKALYPTLGDTGLTIFARDFMDRAIGNYNKAQKPAMFQGSLGTAMGLFQTYMLTWGQNVYRQLELGQYKVLGKNALLQSTIFGANSLPGFDIISHEIADNYSDNNVDLTTGTFRALPNQAQAILYGLPSSIGPAIYTRGDIAPRVYNPLVDGAVKLAAVDMVKQSATTLFKVASAVGDENAARQVGEALSLQSVHRPLARISELFTQTSLTQAGNAVSLPDDVWTMQSALIRAAGSRPINEAVIREARQLDSVYTAMDAANRDKILQRLKVSIRAGTLTDEDVAQMALEYTSKGGDKKRFKGIVSQAIAQVNVDGKERLLDSLKPNNPIMYMLDN